MKSKDIGIALFALVLVASLGWLWFTPSGFKPLPPLTVTTLDNRKLDLQQYKGRPLIVNFWATTCPGCIKEMPHLVELYQELHPKGLELVAVAMEYDPLSQVEQMVREKRLPYPVSHDTQGQISAAFGDVKLTPTTVLIDPQGRIVQQTIGELDMTSLRNRLLGMLQAKGA